MWSSAWIEKIFHVLRWKLSPQHVIRRACPASRRAAERVARRLGASWRLFVALHRGMNGAGAAPRVRPKIGPQESPMTELVAPRDAGGAGAQPPREKGAQPPHGKGAQPPREKGAQPLHKKGAPFPGAAGARARWGWMLFDWASQPYHTLIITFIFAPYFTSAVAPNAVIGQQMWGWTVSAAGLAIAVSAPLLGALADATGPRKPWIALFSVLYILGAAMLWGAMPGDPDPIRVLIWFAIGLIGVEFATVFTNAMMPDLAARADIGKLSGSGWALGYAGGVISLALMLLLLAENAETGLTLLGIAPVLGLDAGAREGTRAVGPLTAIWYAIFIVPLFLWTPDAPPRPARKAGEPGALTRGLRGLRASLRDLKDRRGLRWFLGASMIYRDALGGFYVFGGIYASGVLGWSIVQIGVFGILAALLGAIGAWIGGRADAAFGPRAVVMVSVAVLAAGSLIGVSVSPGRILFVLDVGQGSALPDLIFYAAGGLIGAFGGALQAASRTLLTRFADAERMTAAFGLYALAGKASAFLAPALIAGVTALAEDQQIGVAPVVGLFVLGFLMMLPVREDRT
jgi:UMF1 family MFS transporter